MPHTAISKLREALSEPLGLDPDTGKPWAAQVGVQYVICRRGQARDLRGQCKLAVPAKAQPAAKDEERGRARSELCRRIEERWRALLAEASPGSVIDVEVTWDESRLRRWLSPPGGALVATPSTLRPKPRATRAEDWFGSPDLPWRAGPPTPPRADLDWV